MKALLLIQNHFFVDPGNVEVVFGSVNKDGSWETVVQVAGHVYKVGDVDPYDIVEEVNIKRQH